VDDKPVEIHDGDTYTLTTEDILCDDKIGSISFKKLPRDVSMGTRILINDGVIELIAEKVSTTEIVCRVVHGGTLSNNKGINVPGVKLSMPYLSERDMDDLEFGAKMGFDFIAASFVRTAADINYLRKFTQSLGWFDVRIIAKIENTDGVENIDEILEAADGIMVARGDLGVEIPPEEVPVAQAKIIKMCRKYGKPVITATQMLDSMVDNPRPTRAEVSDVATAINESSDCVMLSAESASGKYPIEACAMQAAIARTQEKYLDYERLAREAYDTSERKNNDAIANSIANTALLIGAKLIVNFTVTGKSSSIISKARPCCPVISVTNRRDTVMRAAYTWGTYGVLLKTPLPEFTEEMEVLALKIARDLGIAPGSPILLSGGIPTGAGQTNFMRILTVNNVADFK
jgi:pyruvate kinase